MTKMFMVLPRKLILLVLSGVALNLEPSIKIYRFIIYDFIVAEIRTSSK